MSLILLWVTHVHLNTNCLIWGMDLNFIWLIYEEYQIPRHLKSLHMHWLEGTLNNAIVWPILSPRSGVNVPVICFLIVITWITKYTHNRWRRHDKAPLLPILTLLVRDPTPCDIADCIWITRFYGLWYYLTMSWTLYKFNQLCASKLPLRPI